MTKADRQLRLSTRKAIIGGAITAPMQMIAGSPPPWGGWSGRSTWDRRHLGRHTGQVQPDGHGDELRAARGAEDRGLGVPPAEQNQGGETLSSPIGRDRKSSPLC